MKKKVLLTTTDLNLGGIETAFLNLVNLLKKDNTIDFDVFLFDSDNEFKLPAGVKVIRGNKLVRMLVVNQQKIKEENSFLGIFRLFCGAFAKFFGHGLIYKLLFFSQPKLYGYDVAISFTQSSHKHSLFGGCNEFVLNRVISAKKISFLHCDYSMCGINTLYSKKIYSKFDKIAAVSEGVRQAFVKCVPELEEKTCVVHNCHDIENIITKSKSDVVTYKTDALNFVTVARLSPEKGHYRALEVFDRLKHEGHKFKWHIIGGADDFTESEFAKKIEAFNLTDSVVMHGNQDNPYRFFPNADVMLLPSYHEAAPMVFSEAEILGLPVITTDTLSAKEFVADRNNGIVCDNSISGIYKAVGNVLKNPDILNKYVEFQDAEYDNQTFVHEFYDLLN